MKRIIAFIKPNMIDDVIFALHEIEDFPGASISEVQGIDRGSYDHLKQGDRAPFHSFPKSIRMEIVCLDTSLEIIVQTIKAKAHTGLPDDGRIYISAVEDAIRIQTGERGEPAI